MPSPIKMIPSEKAAAADRRPFFKRPLPMLGLTASVLLVGVACLLLWAGHKYQALIELGQETGRRYAAIETEHPFDKPDPGQSIDARRWEAMFAVRSRVTEKITPAMDNLVQSIPDMEKPSGMALATKMMSLASDLKTLVDAHMAALEDNAMSAGEYCWLLGLAVNGALANESDSPAGQAYRDILSIAERLSRANDNPRDDIEADKVIREFSRSFDGQTPGESWVVEDLATQNRSVYVLDLLTLAMGAHADEIH